MSAVSAVIPPTNSSISFSPSPHNPLVEQEIVSIKQRIAIIEVKIDVVEKRRDARPEGDSLWLEYNSELKQIRDELKQLRDELRRKEEMLRDKETALLQRTDRSSQAAIAALSQQVQQLQLEHTQEQRQMLIMQARIHRLEHTVTTAGDVGARVLQSATIDPTASFLPTLTTVLSNNILTNLPSGVDRELHSRPIPVSTNTVSSNEPEEQEEEKDTHDTVSEMVHSTRKNPEQPIQSSYTALLPYLLSQLNSSLHFHDTHLRYYLTLPTGKIDVTFSASGAVLWSDVVTLIEFKPSLVRSTPAYNEAVGQVIQRCQDIFDQQPQRTYVVAMVMDAMHIDVLHVSKPAPFKLVHTGRLPFTLSVDNTGFQALCRVLCTPMNRLGFIASVVPAPFDLTSPRGTVSNFLPLRAVSLSQRTSAVYRASCTRWKNKELVVKFAPAGQDADHEASILSQLHVVATANNPCPSSIPTVLAYGLLPKPHDHFHHFLLMEPFGRHLYMGGDEPIGVLCRVLVDVCNAMEYAFCQMNLLHRDISYGNIIMVEQPTMHGVLIDWHVASQQQKVAHPDRITGTPLFTAHQLFFPGHAHSLEDDLESLLYVLLYVATNGRLPWVHSPHKVMDALKYWHLTMNAPFEELLHNCTISLRPLIRQLRGLIFIEGATSTFPPSSNPHQLANSPTMTDSNSIAAAAAQPMQQLLTDNTPHPSHTILRQFRAALHAYST